MFNRILVTTDGSFLSELALPYAVNLALQNEAALHVLYVTPAVPMRFGMGDGVAYARQPREEMEAARAEGERVLCRAAELVDLPRAQFVRREEGEGGVAGTIADEAEKIRADLVVMSTHGRSGLAHLLLGSVAESVVRRVSVPVLLVRAPDAATAAEAHAELARPTA